MVGSSSGRTGSPFWKNSSGSKPQEQNNTVVGASYSHANMLQFVFSPEFVVIIAGRVLIQCTIEGFHSSMQVLKRLNPQLQVTHNITRRRQLERVRLTKNLIRVS